MHPHTRRKTKKRLGRLTLRGNVASKTPALVTPTTFPSANDEELSRLANDLAYFEVARFREITLGDIREEDIKHADAEIAALFKHGNLE